MKPLQVIIVFLLVIGSICPKTAKAQVYKVSKIPVLIKAAKKDRKQKIERMAALKFHKLLNAYRMKNKLNELIWDESLWLTCVNHDLWMNSNGELSHEQKSGTKYFTGIEPGDRYNYATSGKGNYDWSGENALYNYDREGKTVNEISSNIAKAAFEQWKDSPGHNENMLDKRHTAHGVAFYLGKGGRVYGTDLFVSNRDNKYIKNANNQLASLK